MLIGQFVGVVRGFRSPNSGPHFWESAKVSHKGVFALLTPEIHSYEMAQMLQKPVFAFPGCQRMSVNTLLKVWCFGAGWPLLSHFWVAWVLATGKYGCTEVRVYPAECGEQLGRDPPKIGSSKSLVLKSFSREGTLWDSSLLVTLTLWDTPVLFTPPLPLPQGFNLRWVTFESLVAHFNSFCVSVELGARPLHKSKKRAHELQFAVWGFQKFATLASSFWWVSASRFASLPLLCLLATW